MSRGIIGTILLAAALLLGRTPSTASANCQVTYALFDYYSNGVYTHSAWEPDGIVCDNEGPIGEDGSTPGGSGGGGGTGVTVVPVAEGTYVNRVNKTVVTNQINCTAEFGTPAEFAGLYYIAEPNARTGTIITLVGVGDASWKFALTSKTHNPKVTRVPGGTCP